ncbi:MAG: hypothetical protein ACK4UN_13705, partial [Limisphaerales bacterium]
MKVVSLLSSAGILSIALAAVFTVGCASKNNPTVHFQPAVSQALVGTPKASVRVATIQDWRPLHNKSTVGQQRNGHGHRTSDFVLAQKPLGDIFREGLVHAMEENQYQVAPGSGRYELRGGIKEFNCTQVHGFWDATGKSELEVQFELINKVTGNSVWKKSYIGRGTVSTPWSAKGTMGSMFTQSASDVVDQLLADASFRQYF